MLSNIFEHDMAVSKMWENLRVSDAVECSNVLSVLLIILEFSKAEPSTLHHCLLRLIDNSRKRHLRPVFGLTESKEDIINSIPIK